MCKDCEEASVLPLTIDIRIISGYSSMLHNIVQVCPWDVKLREMRAECYESANMYQSAVSDLK